MGLQEFLGDWWMDKSKKFDAKSVTKIGVPRPDLSERNRKSKGKKKSPPSTSHRAALSKALRGKPKSDEAKQNMSEAAKKRCKTAEWKEAQSKRSTQLNLKRNEKGQFIKRKETT